jgi:hypothetical protein
MKKNETLILIVSFFTFMAVIFFTCLCFAQKMQNSECKTFVGSYTCSNAGATCSTPHLRPCIKCDSSNSIPMRSCVYREGESCSLLGGAGANCEDVQRWKAPCERREGATPSMYYYECGEYIDDGTCGAENNYMPCS